MGDGHLRGELQTAVVCWAVTGVNQFSESAPRQRFINTETEVTKNP
jgi:hypothetical protein